MDNQIKSMSDHYIVCGYGRIGRLLTKYLVEKQIKVVVIEKNTERSAQLAEDNVPALIGEATDATLLGTSGIMQAAGIIAGVGTDEHNEHIVRLASKLNPGIFIVARASQDAFKQRLEEAGAHKVISPYDIGARRIAHAILRPTVITFLETAFDDAAPELAFEEIPVKPGANLEQVSLMDSGIRQDLNLLVIAIEKQDGTMVFNPEATTRLCGGDTLIVMGTAGSIQQLEARMQGEERS